MWQKPPLIYSLCYGWVPYVGVTNFAVIMEFRIWEMKHEPLPNWPCSCSCSADIATDNTILPKHVRFTEPLCASAWHHLALRLLRQYFVLAWALLTYYQTINLALLCFAHMQFAVNTHGLTIIMVLPALPQTLRSLQPVLHCIVAYTAEYFHW